MSSVEGVDLLIHDAQYTATSSQRSPTGVTARPEYAVWLAIESGVKQLALFHHDPLHDDDHIDAALTEAEARCHASGTRVVAAREGLTLHVGS